MLKKVLGHFCTITHHKWLVFKLCVRAGIPWRGFMHDWSKYSPTEFWNGVKFYTGTKSPHIGEREKYGYSKAWLHHKGCNKHHAEYWQDIRSSGKTEPIPMPMKYFAEMLCDRVAASMVYLGNNFTNKSALDYYRSHYDENQFHSETREQLEWWLLNIASIGVDKAFNELKENLKEGKKK
jgi:hypothetical protein